MDVIQGRFVMHGKAMMSDRARQEQLKQIDLDIKDAEQYLQQVSDMADRQITEARNEYERQKRETKEQVAEARHRLNIARTRRRNFIKYHYG